jgi:hypothetical protein
MRSLTLIIIVFLLSSCGFVRHIFGYIPPPEETTVSEELQLEFDRCEKINKNRNCAQIAFDTVRKVKGLEPRKVPEGVVIILEGDVNTPPPKKERGVDHPNDTIDNKQ